MKHNNRQLRRLGVALVVLVLIFAAMMATSRQREDVTVVEKTIATLLYPLQWATDWVADRVRGSVEAVRELSSLREQNAQLRETVRDTAQMEARNQALEQENQALRNELNMKERAEHPLLTAEVIGRTSDNWYRTVLINRGSRDGVEPNMAVINWQGLVGKISHTTPYTATVQLVLDAGFGAGARVPSGEQGFIETVQGGEVSMKFFSSDPAVQVGQPVFTSGQAFLARDLLIGYVASQGTSESSVAKFVNIKPAVDFHKLDVVHVVLHPTGKDRGANAP